MLVSMHVFKSEKGIWVSMFRKVITGKVQGQVLDLSHRKLSITW